MRRFFTSLKSVVCVALVACMMGTSVVSCSYDDTDLKNEIAQIQKDLAALKERVADLEKRLQDEVAALKGLVDGKLLVTGVETVGGNTVVTLSDGSTFTIYAPIEDTDTDTDTYLSVKEDGGVYYWAVFNKEGFVEWLLVDGEKVAVVAEAGEAGEGCDCVPAELKFMVDEQSGNLLVSIDGGNTWVDSGLAAKGVAADGSCVFAGAVANEDGTVTFTLADGSTFTVAIAEPIEFNVRGSLYVAAGETKEVTFEAGEAVSDVEVMNQPMGWKASVSENVLSVTAPKSELVALGAADKNGTIALHVNTASGACKVAKLNVNFAELTLDVDKEGNVTVKNSLVATFQQYSYETWMYEEVTDFISYSLGAMRLDDYTGDLEADLGNWYLDSWTCNDENLGYYLETGSYVYDRLPYEEGVVDERVLTTTVKAIVEGLSYGNQPYEGESFLVFAVPFNMTTYNLEPANAAIAEFKQLAVKVEVLEETFNSAKFDVTLRGGVEYHLQYVEAKYIDQNIEYGYTAEDYYQTNFYNWINYGMDWGQHVIREDIAGEFTLDEFMNYEAAYMMNNVLDPDTEYEFSILPIEEGREKESYGYSDLYIFRFKTAALVEAAEPMEITVEPVVDYSSIKASVTVPETAVAVYSSWYDQEFVMGPDEFKNHISSAWCKSDFSEGYTYELNISGLSTGQTKYLVLVAVDAEGNYTFVQEAITTLVPVTNTEYTLGIGSYSFANDAIVVTLTGIDGAEVAKYRYYLVKSDYYSSKSNETIQNELAVSSNWMYQTIEGDAVTNPVVISYGLTSYNYQEGLVAGNTYKFAILAQFADGSFSNVVIIDEAEYEMTVISNTDERWAATKPTCIIELCEWDGYGWDVKYDFEKQEGITVYPSLETEDTMISYPGKSSRVRFLVDKDVWYRDEGYYYQYTNNSLADIYYTWKDADGNFYQADVYELESWLVN